MMAHQTGQRVYIPNLPCYVRTRGIPNKLKANLESRGEVNLINND